MTDQDRETLEAPHHRRPGAGRDRARRPRAWCRRCTSPPPSCAIPTTSIRSGYAYGRPDNATVRQAEAVIAALEGAHEALLFGSGMAAATASCWRCRPAATSSPRRCMYWAFRHWLATRGAAVRLPRRFRRHVGPRRVRAAMKPDDQARLDRDARQSALDHHRHRRRRRDRARGRRHARRRFDRRDAGVHPAARARRRHRDAFGDEISQRPFRRDRGRARGRARRARPGTRIKQVRSAARRDPRAVRGVAAAARAAHARRARARRRPRPPRCSRRASPAIRASQACSIRACRRIPATRSRRGR